MKGYLMTEQNAPAGAGQKKADTGPVPDRPASHPPGPQGRPVESASAAPGERRAPGAVAPTGAGSQGPTPEQQREEDTGEPAPAASGAAAESGHPDVHKALADLQTARLNLEDAKGGEGRDAKVADAEQAVADAEKRLAELGYK